MKTTTYVFAMIICIASCKQNKERETTIGSSVMADTFADTQSKADLHVTQNSIDWEGTYKGVVPCADCEGIETLLMLKSDHTYQLRTNYLGQADAAAIEKSGLFTWRPAGNIVVLQGIENAPNQFFIGENQAIQLDMAGQRITGGLADKYILRKQ